MKQCLNCGMSFGDTVTTCRFCGKAVKPVAAAPKPAPKPAPEYTECIQCHFKQAPGTEKCRFCGGICKVVNPATPAEQQKDEGDKTLTGGNKRELLKAQATELGLTFAANIHLQYPGKHRAALRSGSAEGRRACPSFCQVPAWQFRRAGQS